MRGNRPIHTTLDYTAHDYITKLMKDNDMKMNEVIYMLIDSHKTWEKTTGEKIIKHITAEVLTKYMGEYVKELREEHP